MQHSYSFIIGIQVLDLKANYVSPASGTVIEAQVKRGRGTVATVLVQRGTLKVIGCVELVAS
jgi:translation initiation factor IF-2